MDPNDSNITTHEIMRSAGQSNPQNYNIRCTRATNIYSTVEPQFTNAPVHEQIFRAKNFSDDERCLGLRTRKLAKAASWQQWQAESIGAGVSVAG
jgi:hypothetical protein